MAEWLSTPLIGILSLAILGVVYKVIRWMVSVDKDREFSKDEAKKDRATLREFMKEIRDDIKRIFERLPPAPVAGSSPFQLTDFGEQIAKKLNAHEWAAKLAPELIDDIQGKQPFEIDEFCGIYIQKELGKNMEKEVSKGAYKFGIEKEGVLSVLRVVLRDELLKLGAK